MESPRRQPNLRLVSARTAAGLLCGDRPGVTGAEPDQRLAMYELISIPKRNTTAAGVTHFIVKFLVLISRQSPAIINRLASKHDWCGWQSAHTRGCSPPWNHYSDLMIFMNPAYRWPLRATGHLGVPRPLGATGTWARRAPGAPHGPTWAPRAPGPYGPPWGLRPPVAQWAAAGLRRCPPVVR